MCGSVGTKLRSHSGNEKANSKVKTPILPHTNVSFRAGQINQLILLADAQFLGLGISGHPRALRSSANNSGHTQGRSEKSGRERPGNPTQLCDVVGQKIVGHTIF